MKHKQILIILFFLLTSNILKAQSPAVEIRAVWLTTNWGLDWPKKGKTVSEQKRELELILDELQRDKFNVVLFQTRAQGKVFYNSMIEERSPYYNSKEGFDPLAFAIEACHARQMECHAWITTFPVERAKISKRGTLMEKRPDHYKLVEKNWFLDPGRPETRNRLVLLAKEIVTKYDVDGLHLDYIRYPDNPKIFNDADTYRTYGYGKDKEQWRRENVNRVVFDIYDAVKSIKNWVQVSSSPLGKYKSLGRYDGWTAYESVNQDAGYWMEQGKQDILFPMMYAKGNQFYPHVDKWLVASANRPIVPGLGVYQLEEKEKDWDKKEIADQISYTRDAQTQGQAYFRASQVIENKKGVRASIKAFYKYPAKLPPLTWLSDEKPNKAIELEVFKDEKGLLYFQWDVSDKDKNYTYNIYFSQRDRLNMDDPRGILVANLHQNHYSLTASVGEFGFYYFVTVSDRYHNESNPSESVYFVHSENVY